MRRTGAPAAVVGAVVLALVALGCGREGSVGTADAGATATATGTPESTETPETEGQEPSLPVTLTDATGNDVVVESIDRIIPLDGDVAEIVFALGLGDNVVATDLSATYPPEADALPEVGYQRALSSETVAAFEPTVLLATDIAGPPQALDELRQLGFPLVVVPNEATSTGAAAKIRAIAEALGVPERGEELAGDVQSDIDLATVEAGADAPRVLALYVRGISVQLVLGEQAATHWLIEAAGGVDVSTDLGVTDTAPISIEALLRAEPDVILVPTAGLESVEGIDGLLEIPGMERTPAGRDGRILAYDDQMLLGNGPRAGEMLQQLAEDLDDDAR